MGTGDGVPVWFSLSEAASVEDGEGEGGAGSVGRGGRVSLIRRNLNPYHRA